VEEGDDVTAAAPREAPAPLSGRDAYRAELTALAADDPAIVCLEADLGGRNHPFEQAHPGRFYNLGIAEGAMIDMAAALASAGLKPFVSTFATFAAMRAAESVKLSLGYLGAPVTVVAPYAGVSGGWFGTTHHCLEDLAVLGALPGVTIAAPFGEAETRAVIREAVAAHRPGYVRLGRNAAHHSLPWSGDALPPVVWQGGTPGDGARCLVSVGEYGTELCLAAVQARPGLAHAHLCYLDEAHLRDAAAELADHYGELVVVEEHRGWGGVGSALARLLPYRAVRSVAADGGWPSHGGGREDVAAEVGLDLAAVLRAVVETPVGYGPHEFPRPWERRAA